MKLLRSLKKVSSFLVVCVIFVILLNIFTTNFYEGLPDKAKNIINIPCSAIIKHWVISISVVFGLLVLNIACIVLEQQHEKSREREKIYEFCKHSDKIKLSDFHIQRYEPTYFRRSSDGEIEKSLNSNHGVLITGKPAIGKTRAAYEAIKQLKGMCIVTPEPETEDINEIISHVAGKKIVVFLDDVQRFNAEDIVNLIENVRKKCEQTLIVGTCRTGPELISIKEKEIFPLRELEIIEVSMISEKEGEDLAKKAKIDWNIAKSNFDGTPGSVILDLTAMQNRYRNTNSESKVIMKSLKLMKEAGLFIYKETRVKNVCVNIFQLSSSTITRYGWDELINELKKIGLISAFGGAIYTHDSYLERCVEDYTVDEKDVCQLRNMLIEQRDSVGLFWLGQRFVEKGKLKDARICFGKVIDIYPSYSPAHGKMGYILGKMGEDAAYLYKYIEAEELYKKAIEEYKMAIDLNPSCAAINYNSIGFTLTRLGEINEAEGKNSEARELFMQSVEMTQKAVDLRDDYSEAYRSLAYALNKLGQKEDAKRNYIKAININPECPYTYNLLGHLLAELREIGEAQKMYEKAIEIDPRYFSAHNNFGCLLRDLNELDKAESEFRKAIEIKPDYLVAMVNLGRLLVMNSNYVEAITLFEKALTINYEYTQARVALMYVLNATHQYEKAIEEYQDIVKKKRNCLEAQKIAARAMVGLGKECFKNGNEVEADKWFAQAEDQLRDILNMRPDNSGDIISLGIVLERRK